MQKLCKQKRKISKTRIKYWQFALFHNFLMKIKIGGWLLGCSAVKNGSKNLQRQKSKSNPSKDTEMEKICKRQKAGKLHILSIPIHFC